MFWDHNSKTMATSTTPSKRKRPRSSGKLLKYGPSTEKYIKTMANKRRRKITKLLNLQKRHPEKNPKRILKPDVLFLVIKTDFFEEIRTGKKNREFRSRSKKTNVKSIGERHKKLRYILFWARGRKEGEMIYMLTEFNGLDYHHEQSKEDYVLKIGEILNVSPTKIVDDKRAYH